MSPGHSSLSVRTLAKRHGAPWNSSKFSHVFGKWHNSIYSSRHPSGSHKLNNAEVGIIYLESWFRAIEMGWCIPIMPTAINEHVLSILRGIFLHKVSYSSKINSWIIVWLTMGCVIGTIYQVEYRWTTK